MRVPNAGHRKRTALTAPQEAPELQAASISSAESVSRDDGWVIKAIGATKTKAGVSVSESVARQLSAVYACINRISNPIAGVPMRMYRRRQSDGSAEPVTAAMHPFAQALTLRPNAGMASRTLRKTAQGHALLWGNGYIEIERNGRGQTVGLYPLLPDRTSPVRQDGRHFFRTSIGGRRFEIDSNDVIHIMDQSQDGYVGLSQIALARQALGISFATEEFGAKFFANDAKSGGFLMHPGKLGGNARRNLTGPGGERVTSPESPATALESQSGLDNAHRVKVLEEGMKFIQTTIPPEDAQFLGTRDYQVAEVCRIYDVPLIMVQSHQGTTTWGTGIEQLMIGFINQTVLPWVTGWEQEMNWKLFTEEERDQGFYVKLQLNALMRGDMQARAEFYSKLFGIAGLSPNQILALEEMDGIGPDGDHHFVQGGYVTLDRAIRPPAVAAPAQVAAEQPANSEGDVEEEVEP